MLIDGAGLHAASRALGFQVEYRKLEAAFADRGRLARAYYYAAVDAEADHVAVRPLLDWLEYNGFGVVTKPVKTFVDAQGGCKAKGSMDVEMAVQALAIAPHVDELVLFTGDGGMAALVAGLQRRGVRVTVVSTVSTRPPMAADELRRQADRFVDLADLAGAIGRQAPSRAKAG